MAQVPRTPEEDSPKFDPDHIPVAPLVSMIREADTGLWVVKIRCPYKCGKRFHIHGGGSSDLPSLGHRVSHCGPVTYGAGSYYLGLVDVDA